jgi:hypothetical protein
MELVKDYCSDPFKGSITLQHSRKNTFGDHLDSGTRTDPCIEAHAIAHGFTDPLPKRLSHAFGDGTRCETTRFEHQEFSITRPGFLEQCEWHHRALAGARRGLENSRATARERRAQGRQRLENRQCRQVSHWRDESG